MQDLNDLYYFVQVVDHGGFAPAGRSLAMPKSKLSRRIARLEARLDVRLLQRTTRRFSVTEIGRIYYAHCKAMLVEAAAAQESIDATRAEPCGVVRVACPVALLEERVGGMLARFMARNPQVEVHLDATDRRVDLVSEGVDVAIRVRRPPLEDTDLVMRVLGERAQCLVASPEWLARVAGGRKPRNACRREVGALATPTDLAGLPSLAHGTPQPRHAWTLRGPEGSEVEIEHRPRLVTRDMLALRAAALAGVGVVHLPTMMVSAELASGELVRPLPDWAPRSEVIHAVYPSRRGLLPSVRTLVDFLAESFAELRED